MNIFMLCPRRMSGFIAVGLALLASSSLAASQIMAPALAPSVEIGEFARDDASEAKNIRQLDASDARVRAIRLSAEQGQPEAEDILGRMYSVGQGVVRDDDIAAQWYRKAADQGYAAAQNRLGYAYLKGLGVPQNDALAVQWMTKSAEGGYAPAQDNVGVFYEYGLYGLPRDVDRALEWYRTAAAQDYAPAQFKVGVCFQRGIGVPPDLKVAAHWFALSAQGGDLKAKVNLGYLYMT
ncbi:tetratricopeptide repeat protein, partial [Paraburkholderia sediminicola]